MLVIVLCCVTFAAKISPSYAAGGGGSGGGIVYREDYVYNQPTDAFYKLHMEPVSWPRAKEVCAEEKATLLGLSDGDLLFGHTLMKKHPDVAKEVFVINDGKQHQDEDDYTEDVDVDYESTIHQRYPDASQGIGYSSQCNAFTMRGKLVSIQCFNTRAFICKVARVDLRYNEDCKLYDSDFKYNAALGSCYKFKATPYTWGQALASCVSEGAHLAVVNSQAEADYFKSELMGIKVSGSTSNEEYFWHVGFRSHPELGDPVYRTIFNQTLTEAGYDAWSPGEPNNYQNSEHCGSLFRNTGQFNDLSCEHLNGFICEKEIQKT